MIHSITAIFGNGGVSGLQIYIFFFFLFIMPINSAPFHFQLLELNIISAQDLAPVNRPMRTYAVTWVHPDRKLSTRLDTHGHVNPTWNDKFVFRVDEDFLYADTSAIMIEIYAVHWFKDIQVGTVRVLLSNVVPRKPSQAEGMRFVALQVRRRSGRPQGILNIGAAVLDSSLRSVPVYTHSPSAVGFRHLMGIGEKIEHKYKYMMSPVVNINNGKSKPQPQLRRTKSDNSSIMCSSIPLPPPYPPSIVLPNKKPKKGSSVKSKTNKSKKSPIPSPSPLDVVKSPESKKAQNKNENDDVVSEAESSSSSSEETITTSSESGESSESEKKFEGMTSHNNVCEVKASPPRLLQFANSPMSAKFSHKSETPQRNIPPTPLHAALGRTRNTPLHLHTLGSARNTPMHVLGMGSASNSPMHPLGMGSARNTPMHARVRSRNNTPFIEYNTPRRSHLGNFGPPVMTDSELGPSPSEVAAAIAMQEPVEPVEEGKNSVVGGWSLAESAEGLESKMERWRTGLPPVYDSSDSRSAPSTVSSSSRKTRKHNTSKRRTKSAGGLFSCFSNMLGIQCTIVYGSDNAKKKAAAGTSRHHRTPSMESTTLA